MGVLLIDMQSTKPLGGYFGLELPEKDEFIHKDGNTYQSARAAFRALLQEKRPTKVWVPKYICDAMITPLADEGIEYSWYELDETLYIQDPIVLGDDEWLLCVNYYGICQAQMDDIFYRYPAKQIVCDFSQAFFDAPRADALATIYSARKFFGVPDGAVLLSDVPINIPALQDEDSLPRMTHLLKRLYKEPELGYDDYLSAESSLLDTTPMQMSELTKSLLRSIDFSSAKKKRIDNFNYLHDKLKGINQIFFDDKEVVAPLCYPLVTENNHLRDVLIKNRVFVPMYWKEALARVESSWGKKMINQLLPLPLDQRYDSVDMENLVSLIMDNSK